MSKKLAKLLMVAGVIWFGVLSQPLMAGDDLSDSEEKCAFGFDYFSLETSPSLDFGIGGADGRYFCSNLVDSLRRRSPSKSKKVVESGWICSGMSQPDNFDPCPKGGTVTWAGNAYSCSYAREDHPTECAEGFGEAITALEGSDSCAPPADFCCYNSSPCGEEGVMVASEANRVCCVEYKKYSSKPFDLKSLDSSDPNYNRKLQKLQEKDDKKNR